MSNDMIINWSNTLRSSNSGETIVAEHTASALKSKGYSESEALDVMIGDNYNMRIAENAINTIFNATPVVSAPEEEIDVITSAVNAFKNRTVTASVNRKNISVALVPTSYTEMAPVIEDALNRYSSAEFVEKLTSGNNPLILANKTTRESWYRLANRAKNDPRALSFLHSELEPFLSDALLNSVLVAENPQTALKIANNKGDKYVVASSTNKKVEVDLESGTCTCSRYAERNFEDFGLPCEHIVYVADSVSPYQRLAKALKK